MRDLILLFVHGIVAVLRLARLTRERRDASSRSWINGQDINAHEAGQLSAGAALSHANCRVSRNSPRKREFWRNYEFATHRIFIRAPLYWMRPFVRSVG